MYISTHWHFSCNNYLIKLFCNILSIKNAPFEGRQRRHFIGENLKLYRNSHPLATFFTSVFVAVTQAHKHTPTAMRSSFCMSQASAKPISAADMGMAEAKAKKHKLLKIAAVMQAKQLNAARAQMTTDELAMAFRLASSSPHNLCLVAYTRNCIISLFQKKASFTMGKGGLTSDFFMQNCDMNTQMLLSQHLFYKYLFIYAYFTYFDIYAI
jgi:hypothetical protein